MAGSANIGLHGAMFEAIHGSAPDLAGKNLANPSGLLNAAVMMLAHLGQAETANRIANAWLSTLEQGIHTQDIFQRGTSFRKVGTREFGDEVIARLGEQPRVFQPAAYTARPMGLDLPPAPQRQTARKELVGADIFLHESHLSPDDLGGLLESLAPAHLRLKMITNRGVKVYPGGVPGTFLTDHWRCRFVSTEADISDPRNPRYRPVSYDGVLALLGRLHARGLDIIKTEHLYLFDGERGFSLGQGE
jgi:isocitrate dehydrogenase